MKRSMLVSVFFTLLVVAFCSAQDYSGNYGSTTDGAYYIKISLCTSAGYNNMPSVLGDLTDWKPVKATRVGDYWVIKTGKFNFLPTTYCFHFGGDNYLPYDFNGKSQFRNQINVDDIVDNEQGGVNFKTKPVKKKI